ncbi:MAG TPA: hypothetical protein VFP58_08685 [Candidatus Eisenbacteria bacterium]|nr:hypothetical protein [Candidatus Eisenbacteria bacterium]
MKTHARPWNGTARGSASQLWWSPLASSPRGSRTRTHLTHAHVPPIGAKTALRLIGLPFFVALACVLVTALSLLFATAPPSP